MADFSSSQPIHNADFDRLENKLEQWREHLTSLGSSLAPGELQKLSRQWDALRQSFDVACLHGGLEIHGLEAFMEALPDFRHMTESELEIVHDGLKIAKKTLKSMLSETDARVSLLEESLNADKQSRIRKSLDKLRLIDESLQTRLLGLDAYIEQFELAKVEGLDLVQSTKMVMEQTQRINDLTQSNSELEAKTKQMNQWLVDSKLSLTRMPLAAPPSPSSIQQASLSLGNGSEVDKALMALFSNSEKLKDARLYLENYLADRDAENNS